MRRPVPSRLIAVALAAGSLLMVPLAASAGAATPTTCSKATFSATNTVTSIAKSTLGGCTNPTLTGGSGVLVANFKVTTKITVKITWHGTGTSSFTLKEGGTPKGVVNHCKGAGKTQDTLIVTTGVVTAGTGKAVALNKTKFSESLCVHTVTVGKKSTITEYLEPTSKIAI
jgi:hypothetical protein